MTFFGALLCRLVAAIPLPPWGLEGVLGPLLVLLCSWWMSRVSAPAVEDLCHETLELDDRASMTTTSPSKGLLALVVSSLVMASCWLPLLRLLVPLLLQEAPPPQHNPNILVESWIQWNQWLACGACCYTVACVPQRIHQAHSWKSLSVWSELSVWCWEPPPPCLYFPAQLAVRFLGCRPALSTFRLVSMGGITLIFWRMTSSMVSPMLISFSK